MIYLQLFLSFVKVGFTSFGGMSMVPVIMEEMGSHGWMTAEDLSNLIAIAEMTPGSLGVNCATFAGIQTAGFFGGLVAVLGVLTPALTLTLVVAIFFTRFQKNPVMQRVLRVVKPICVAMILGVLVTLFQSSILPGRRLDLAALGIAVLCFVLLRTRKCSIPAVIGLAAALGVVCYGVVPIL
ncbi:MAG: chromate transporter [Oscillospiraceae bacterium]|nr:chromate transporter [Oscillospiraceae bacterium]